MQVLSKNTTLDAEMVARQGRRPNFLLGELWILRAVLANKGLML